MTSHARAVEHAAICAYSTYVVLGNALKCKCVLAFFVPKNPLSSSSLLLKDREKQEAVFFAKATNHLLLPPHCVLPYAEREWGRPLDRNLCHFWRTKWPKKKKKKGGGRF